MSESNSGFPPLWLLVLAFVALLGKQVFGVWSPLLHLFVGISFLTVAARSILRMP